MIPYLRSSEFVVGAGVPTAPSPASQDFILAKIFRRYNRRLLPLQLLNYLKLYPETNVLFRKNTNFAAV